MRTLIAGLKFLAFILTCLVLVPLQLLVLLFHRGPHAYILTMLWHKIICKIFRIKVVVKGTPAHNKQVFFVSNHISYLDIPVVATVLKASFVAKKDVQSWPVFGFLSRLQQTAFISRTRTDAKREKNALENMLRENKSMILFPEGTSTEGVEVLPFKSSLFSLALGEGRENLMIQPFTISMLGINGKKPENQNERDIYAWHINMDTPLHIHLWRFAKNKGATICLNFHDLVDPKQNNDRKVLAKTCHDAVASGLET